VRAVLDPNIAIAALLSQQGAPAQIVSRWHDGEFELVVSEQLLAELERASTSSTCEARDLDDVLTPV
jgi:predicted nucleic acid-binding protein